MTNPNGLVLDVFQFTDDERFLELNPDAHDRVLHVLEDVVSGRADVTALLRGREQGVLQSEGALAVRAGRARRQRGIRPLHDSRHRRAATRWACSTGSAASSRSHGCDVDLVLIATEGEKAIDVFHITKGGSKLTEAEQQALTSDLHRTLEGLL